MIITGIVELDTAFINVETFATAVDLTLADLRKDLVRKYVEYRAGEEAKAELAEANLSPV